MNRTKTNPIVTAQAKAAVVRYIEIALDNNAVGLVREDLIKRDGSEVIYELLDTLAELFPQLSEDDRVSVGIEALFILKTILINR